MEGPEGSLLHRSGREGVLFGAGLGLFSTGWPTGPKRPGSTAPTSKGRSGPLEVSTLFPAASRPPLLPASLPIPGHYYFIQVTLVLARRAGNRREGLEELIGPQEGKEVGAAAPTL